MLSSLNPAQRAAVEYTQGPELVIAGAGSGKTRVLTYKIAYLLSLGMHAGNILALTFTNKAAREMKERIVRLLPNGDARYLWMGTFHSIAGRILRTEADAIGYTRDFTIYDTADSKALIKRILKTRGLDEKIYKLSTVLAKISNAKNALISPEQYGLRSDCTHADSAMRMYDMPAVYKDYQRHLREANAMDFDDLLVNLCLLLQSNEPIRTKYQEAFQYVLVDEYQDTNYVQYLLVKLLAEPSQCICVVGDDAQSIYSFRGADIRNILSFQRTYPTAQVFKLERNYRSTQTIVQAANSLIGHNEHQIPKEVYSEKEEGQKIGVKRFATDRDEGEGIAKIISEESLSLRHYSPEDIAILYRTNAQSRVFEAALRQRNIPYRIYGGTSFYQRKEVKDIIGYFRLAVNPADDTALQRVINFPARGIGDTTLKKVLACAEQNNLSMFDICANPAQFQLPVSAATAKKLQAFTIMVQGFQTDIEDVDAYSFADRVIRESGLKTAALTDRTPEGIERAENMDELLNSIHEYVETFGNGSMADDSTKPRITDFLAEVSLLTDQDENQNDQTPRVTLMTVHAAKGLEFPVVYIVGLEEMLFPSQMSIEPQEIEEERRLLYVAITRAMEVCHMSFAQQRFRNGKTEITSPSRFLKDIDRRYLSLHAPEQPLATRFTPSPYTAPATSSSHFAAPAPPSSRPTKHVSAVRSEQFDLYHEGDRVSHRTFGNGTVLSVFNDTDSGNDKIEIQFDEYGLKTLLLTYAKLIKL